MGEIFSLAASGGLISFKKSLRTIERSNRNSEVVIPNWFSFDQALKLAFNTLFFFFFFFF